MKKAESQLVKTGKQSEKLSKSIDSAFRSSGKSAQSLGQSMKSALSEMQSQRAMLNASTQAASAYRAVIESLTATQERQKQAIEQTKSRIAEIKQQYSGVVPESGFENINNTLREQQAALDGTKGALADATQRFMQFSGEADRVSSTLNETSQTAGRLRSAFNFKNVLSGIGGALKGLTGFGVIKNIAGHFRNASVSGASLSNVAGTLAGKIFSLGNIFKTKILSLAIGAVFKHMGTAMNSLAAHSTSVKNALSSLSAGAKGISGSLVSAFAPILTSVQPILSNLISMVTNAINAVSQFFAKLSGASSWKKAVPALEAVGNAANGAAGGTEKAANAAEAYKRSVMGFDQLNKLDDQSSGSSGGSGGSGGGGGGGGSGSGGEGITWVDMPINNEVSQFAEKFKEAWEKADFTEIGRIVGEKLKAALESIPWDDIKEKCNKVAKSVATFLNGFFETPGLFEVVGKTIGEGLNTAIGTVHTFLDNLHTDSIGKAITTALYNAFKTLDFKQIGALASDIPKKIYDFIRGGIEGVDWSALPGDIVQKISDFFAGYDFSGIAKSFGALLGAALKAGIDLIGGIGSLIGDAFFTLGDYFKTKINECGGNIWKGILKGIKDAIKNIATWIKNNLWTPFINGFKSAFGLNNGAKDLVDKGKSVISGILKGIKEKAKAIKDFFKNPLGKIKITLSKGFETAKKAWESIKDSTVVKTLKSAGKNAIDKVKELWESIKDGTALKTLKQTGKAIIDKVKTAWDAIRNNIAVKTLQSVGKKAIDKVKVAWDAIRNSTAVKTLQSVGKKAIDNLKVVWDAIRNNIAVKTLQMVGSKAVEKFKGIWEGIKKKTVQLTATIDQGFKSFIDWTSKNGKKISTTITGALSSGAKTLSDWVKKAPEITIKFFADIAENIAKLIGFLTGDTEFLVSPEIQVASDDLKNRLDEWQAAYDENPLSMKVQLEADGLDTSGLSEEDKSVDDGTLHAAHMDQGLIPKADKTIKDVVAETNRLRFDGLSATQKRVDGTMRISSINPKSNLNPTIENGKLEVSTISDKISEVKKVINGITGQLKELVTTGLKKSLLVDAIANFIGKKYDKKTGGSSAFRTFASFANFVGKQFDGVSGYGAAKKFGIFRSIANFLTKSYDGYSGGSKGFRTFGSIANFLTKSYDGYSGGSSAFRTFASTASFGSRVFGSAWNSVIYGMQASFGSHLKGSGFSSTVGSMTASFTSYKKTFTTIGGLIASFNNWVHGNKDGGVFVNGSWKPVTQFATGGTVTGGQLFVAREAGPELVGTIGSNTAVVNNDQIVASVAAGVRSAVMDALMAAGGRGGDIVLYVDSTELARASLKGSKLLDKQMNPHVVFG